MKLIRELIEAVPPSKMIPFGHVNNIMVQSIDTKDHLAVNDHIINVTLYQVDPERDMKPVARSYGSYWALKAGDRLRSNTLNILNSLVSLGIAMGIDGESFLADCFQSIEDDKVEEWFESNPSQVQVDALQKDLFKAVDKYFTEDLLKTSLLKAKIIYNRNGYFELGRTINWALPNESEDPLEDISKAETDAYREWKANKGKKVKADSTKPGKKGRKSFKSVATKGKISTSPAKKGTDQPVGQGLD